MSEGFYKEVKKYEKRIDRDIKRQQKKEDRFATFKSKCSHCGKTLVLPSRTDRVVCNVCGYYIYRNKDVEQKYVKEEKTRNFEKMLKKFLKETEDDNQINRRKLAKIRNRKNTRKSK